MHITLEADYAVRIVHCLAKNGQRMDAKSISDETGVTLRFSLKILRKLVSAGIIKSYKGTQGGYETARPLGEITLNDVIETVEGPFALSRCLRQDYDCGQNCCGDGDCDCVFRDIYGEISQGVKEKLSAVKFSDLIGRDGPYIPQ